MLHFPGSHPWSGNNKILQNQINTQAKRISVIKEAETSFYFPVSNVIAEQAAHSMSKVSALYFFAACTKLNKDDVSQVCPHNSELLQRLE